MKSESRRTTKSVGSKEEQGRPDTRLIERWITTDPVYYEEHTESVEFWSPGNPLFHAPEVTTTTAEFRAEGNLETLLDQSP